MTRHTVFVCVSWLCYVTFFKTIKKQLKTRSTALGKVLPDGPITFQNAAIVLRSYAQGKSGQIRRSAEGITQISLFVSVPVLFLSPSMSRTLANLSTRSTESLAERKSLKFYCHHSPTLICLHVCHNFSL